MNCIRTIRLLATLCTVLLPILLPSHALAQRKLVPVKCNAEELENGWVCLDSLFVEEGTVPPDSCERFMFWSEVRPDLPWRLLFTNFRISLSFTGQDAYADEFRELCESRGVIDSSNAYLLDAQVRAFAALLQDEVGFDHVVARKITPRGTKTPPRFSCTIPNPRYYNYWKVKQLWALSRGADTTDPAAVLASQRGTDPYGITAMELNLTSPCFILVSVKNDSPSSTPSGPTAVSHGNIQVTGFQGPYTLYDISGRIITHGELFQGDENRVLQVNPGMYFLQSATSVKTFMVLP
jgi:hypothetical protein